MTATWALATALAAALLIHGCKSANPWDAAPWHYGYEPAGNSMEWRDR